ncbi:glycosyltransferase [Micromonospora parathelypteridis]|uniref:Alpha-1,6-mannosyltransferase n=1 Tax=Micromonospora parathelypteridis TaxID=1839617 RepID=A0A840W3L7_9ACTN|nr:glycosyltransferase [Micromonospora parathelypteridis]MBB5479380.1 alpha-1,6-mannosyltransferase [Micromonospora parathelypteridis]GGO01584.1 GDP-mannose-dependent alpha-(1-6)-phosphatidylinositol dimannoside mannosyltransferase [Micromonospora parathelypteridis]
MTGAAGGLRIVRLANFVTARSGGLRTALRHLGEGYREAGHEPVLVIPGQRAADESYPWGRVVTLPGPELPGSGGYRLLANRRRSARLLVDLAPDRLEVSDRLSLRWTGRWARAHGVPSVMVSHESLTGLLGQWGVPDALRRPTADRLNRATSRAYDRIVCTTRWAAQEFDRIGADNVDLVPLGVDLDTFHPGRADPRLRARYADSNELLLVHCARLSPEKRPELAVQALAELRREGVPAVLVMAGDGPLRGALARRAAGLPVTFTGFLPDRAAVAALLASADVVLAPGPVETFGLAGLEALACGTPVVVNSASALPEVVGAAGLAAHGSGESMAAAVTRLAARPEVERRRLARARAEEFGWPAAVAGFLRVHDANAPRGTPSEVAHRTA